MDVFLLSRLLRELVIDNEVVPIPSLGYLTSEPTSAKFSTDGLSILPPSRKITFKADKMASGEMIWKYYAQESGVEEETARVELETFMTQLIPTLRTKKVIDFQGIGRLRCTSDGYVYFAPADTDNVFDSAFSFEPVTLKPLSKNERAESITSNTPAPKPKPRRRRALVISLAVLGAIIIIGVAAFFLAKSGTLDSLLYTEEELQYLQNL